MQIAGFIHRRQNYATPGHIIISRLQGGLVFVALVGIALIMIQRSSQPLRQIAIVVAVNLLVNLVFFLSHPIFQQYYIMPVAMLSLWSLLFGGLMQNRLSVTAVPSRIKDAVAV